MQANIVGLKALKLFNSQLKHLLIFEPKTNKPMQTPKCNYSKVDPANLIDPVLLSVSKLACDVLDLDYDEVVKDRLTAEYLSGNKLLNDSTPIAHCYCGYQFRYFAGQLGDGRAISLGDMYNKKNELWEIQLKGAGKTPYSRFADGRAVLRSSIREYLASEHLYSLGIPTTRALSIVVSHTQKTVRDPFYDGFPDDENTAIVTRIAPTFWRFGSFEIFKGTDNTSGNSGPSPGLESEMMENMFNYIIDYHFQALKQIFSEKETLYMEVFKCIAYRTSHLAALWQSYGFCHGVLNTDNLSIIGLTIDYGPYGMMEYFDKDFIPNHSDKDGLYSYSNQYDSVKWDVYKLSEALDFLIDRKTTQAWLDENFDKSYKDMFYLINSIKIGVFNNFDESLTISLINDLYTLLNEFGIDLTTFFRNLSKINLANVYGINEFCLISKEEFVNLMIGYSMSYKEKVDKDKPKLSEEQIGKLLEMSSVNPHLLMRFGLDPSMVDKQSEKSKSYAEFCKKTDDEFSKHKFEKILEWVNRYEEIVFKDVNSSTKETSLRMLKIYNQYNQFKLSEDCHKPIIENVIKQEISKFDSKETCSSNRRIIMNNVNPKFILRNYLAQKAIRKADDKDYSETERLLKVMTTPFEENSVYDDYKYFDTSYRLSTSVCVSCSS